MSGKELDDMTLEKFKFWKVPALKDFLRKRNLSCVGTKEMLVARVFAAWEKNIPVEKTAPEREKKLALEYRSLLITEDEGVMPDPFWDLNEGWENEDKGMGNWPCILIQDISAYLTKHDVKTNDASLTRRLLSDYKEQKAYSYFSSQWLFEINYHKISEESSYCYLKAQCRPSQRISDIPHDVWILISKTEGYIHSAYCTCFAGFGQSCNHVAAVLLKVDFCWQYGHVKMACTSRPCTWRQGGKSVIAAPQKICDLQLKKPTAMKPAPGKQLNTVQKRLFTPHQTTKGMAFEKFLEELSEISPRSVTLGERLPLRNPYYVELDNAKKSKDSSKLPKSISELAGEHQNVKDFLSSIPKYTDQDYEAVEKETRGQADNPVWLNQRDGRITASKFRDVYTRVESFKKNDNTDMDSIISRVLGYVKPPSNLPALKYGRRMESVAVEKYTEVLKENNHKKIEIIECGLFVDKTFPYLGASPDRLVKCCCGTRVLEVKCPLSCSHTKPSEESVDCLIKLNDRVELNKNHKYMDQIQGQMALTGCTKGDLFVFSRHGYLLREISFDEHRWNDMCLNFSLFFEKFLANELVNMTVKEKCAKECVRKLPTCDTSPVYSAGNTCTYTTKNTKRARKQTGKGKKGAKKIRPVYMCKICDKQILESDQMITDEDQSIQCDKCRMWVHWVCVGLFCDSEELGEDEWICNTCKFIPVNL